jgi:hypothetical protein
MKLTITAKPKTVEKVNFLLAQSIDSLKNNPHIRQGFGLKESDLDKVEEFRQELLRAFTGELSEK